MSKWVQAKIEGWRREAVDFSDPSNGETVRILSTRLLESLDEIERLRELGRWIPVSERLPEPGALVPVVIRWDLDFGGSKFRWAEARITRSLGWDGDPVTREWTLERPLRPDETVTHWGLLPPFPGEDR